MKSNTQKLNETIIKLESTKNDLELKLKDIEQRINALKSMFKIYKNERPT